MDTPTSLQPPASLVPAFFGTFRRGRFSASKKTWTLAITSVTIQEKWGRMVEQCGRACLTAPPADGGHSEESEASLQAVKAGKISHYCAWLRLKIILFASCFAKRLTWRIQSSKLPTQGYPKGIVIDTTPLNVVAFPFDAWISMVQVKIPFWWL